MANYNVHTKLEPRYQRLHIPSLLLQKILFEFSFWGFLGRAIRFDADEDGHIFDILDYLSSILRRNQYSNDAIFQKGLLIFVKDTTNQA